MSVLLDTHTFFWAGQSSNKLSQRAEDILVDSRIDVYVSAATAWEIGTKVWRGKWPEAAALERDFMSVIQTAGFRVLAMSVEHALLSTRLPGKHRDPFDRMLAAQALTLGLPILSKDRELDSFGVERIW